MEKAAAARRCATSGMTALCHRLTKQFSAAKGERQNLVFSPLSIHSALSLVAAGAQGRTLSELLGLLGEGSREGLEANARGVLDRAFPEGAQQEGGPRVSYACGVWHDSTRTLKPAYRDVAAASFRSEVRAVDFLTKPEEARRQINSWVAEATNKLIDSILHPRSVDENTRLLLANAIYFKGSWAKPFDKSETRKDKFHCLDGSVVDAQFMSSAKNQMRFVGVHDGFKVLRMPYTVPTSPRRCMTGTTQQNRAAMAAALPRAMPPRYSMCVLLPDAHDGLWSLEDKVASSNGFLQDHLPEKAVEVGKFMVPKFKLSFFTSVTTALQDLGVQAAFSIGAELGMLEDSGSYEPLWLDDVLHKAVIEVNEEGTEAAAVTGILPKGCSRQQRPPPRVDFVADHPFAFFVVEEGSGAILFAGHVLDPTRP